MPVAYTYTPVEGESALSIDIPADANGNAVDDDLQVTLYTNFAKGNRTYSLEISNGARFWLDLTVKGEDTPTSIEGAEVTTYQVAVSENQIYVTNALSTVTLYDAASGQLIRSVAPEVAAQCVYVGTGIYLLTLADAVETVIVQ